MVLGQEELSRPAVLSASPGVRKAIPPTPTSNIHGFTAPRFAALLLFKDAKLTAMVDQSASRIDRVDSRCPSRGADRYHAA